MPETHDHRSGSLPAPACALVISGPQATPDDRNLTRLLDLFGVPWKSASVCNPDATERAGTYTVMTSAACLAKVMYDAGAALPQWMAKSSTVYVYDFRDDHASTKLLRLLTGDPHAKVRRLEIGATVLRVTGDFAEMCGPMSGMRVAMTLREPAWICDGGGRGKEFQSIIGVDEGEIFFGVSYAGKRFFLNTWNRTIDLDAVAPTYFDVKNVFCEAVPPVFYVNWAFRGVGAKRPETNASLIVDDPPLKSRYGFLDFREALGLMDRHNFSTTIAFIPWNWCRSDPATVSLFQNRPEKLSLVIHGCDHTASEFGLRSPALLNGKIRTSLQRMELFEGRAGITADRVMVFPQGVFSPETGRALKLNGFIAAVNTEVAPSEAAENRTTIADLWNVAIMKYGTFPIFTRRYADHGIENFAFDALLGKPCLIASHHEFFKDRARDMMDFVASLNSLRWNIVWRPLGEVVRRSVVVRRLEDGTSVLRMFAASSAVQNTDGEAHWVLLVKEEGDPDCVDAVWVNGTPVKFGVDDGCLQVCIMLRPGEKAVVRVVYRNNLEAIANPDGGNARIRIAANRYLSEFRDNYLSHSDLLYRGAHRLKRRLLSWTSSGLTQ